jgi:hypothetical protein
MVRIAPQVRQGGFQSGAAHQRPPLTVLRERPRATVPQHVINPALESRTRAFGRAQAVGKVVGTARGDEYVLGLAHFNFICLLAKTMRSPASERL